MKQRQRCIWLSLSLVTAALLMALFPLQATEASNGVYQRPTLTPTATLPPSTETPAPTPPPGPVAPTHTSTPLFGRVLRLEDSSGISGAKVTFRMSTVDVWETVTDASGRFSLPDVHEGWGYLEAALPEGVNGTALTGPLLLHILYAEPSEVVWGVTTTGGHAPIAPAIQALGMSIHANNSVTVTLRIPNTTSYSPSKALLTVQLPTGVEVTGVRSAQGTVLVEGERLAFRLGALPPGANVSVEIGLRTANGARPGSQALTAHLTYGEFVAGQTARNVTLNGLSLLPQTGVLNILLLLAIAIGLLGLITLLARRRLHHTAEQQ